MDEKLTRKPKVTKQKITKIGFTDEHLTSRGGLIFFIKYLENIGIYSHLNSMFGSIRKNNKGQAVVVLFKQLFSFFIDGTSFHMTRFDDLKKDESYADIIEETPNSLASSHTMKRFIKGFSFVRIWSFRRLLHTLFIWRLKIIKPKVIILNIDTMPMDNDTALKREGVELTYKKVKGFAPLQLTWGRYIIDAVLRGGSKHSNYSDTVIKMIVHIVKKIRKDYDSDALILLRCDSGFFDQKNMEAFETLGIAYIIGGKVYNDIKTIAKTTAPGRWDRYVKGQQEWKYIESGDRRGTWDRFRRMFYSRYVTNDDGQVIMDFNRPDSVIYTNLGVDSIITSAFKETGLEHYLTGNGIIECYHGRGNDELVHRGLKDFGTEKLPFKRFTPNAVYYYSMLVSYFLTESFKEDVGEDTIPIGYYATTLRRMVIDTAAKIIRTGGELIVKFYRAVYKQINAEQLWKDVLHPPPIPV